jgi:glutamate racemase
LKTIGVFDSGLGGLSVLRALLLEMPDVRYVYLADGAYTPYGGRSAAQVTERAHRITQRLRKDYAVDALVVACNTATAMAIESLRQEHPDWPIVGVEPALKPAAALSQSGHIGVLATRGTVESERFARLRTRVETESSRPVHFTAQACEGLADAIERGDETTTRVLCARYLDALHANAKTPEPMDTLVLGCTHYPFAADILQALSGPAVRLVETGAPVARRTRAVLGLPEANTAACEKPKITLLSTGDPAALAQASARWLGTTVGATQVDF